MTEIVPGIYQLPLSIPNNHLGCTNIYLLRGDECLLIDAGWDSEEALQSLQRQLAEIGGQHQGHLANSSYPWPSRPLWSGGQVEATFSG